MTELFVLGDGASNASAGTPLGKDLVWTYSRDCSALSQIGDDGRRLTSDIEREKEEFANLGHLLKAIEHKYPKLPVYSMWLIFEINSFFEALSDSSS